MPSLQRRSDDAAHPPCAAATRPTAINDGSSAIPRAASFGRSEDRGNKGGVDSNVEQALVVIRDELRALQRMLRLRLLKAGGTGQPAVATSSERANLKHQSLHVPGSAPQPVLPVRTSGQGLTATPATLDAAVLRALLREEVSIAVNEALSRLLTTAAHVSCEEDMSAATDSTAATPTAVLARQTRPLAGVLPLTTSELAGAVDGTETISVGQPISRPCGPAARSRSRLDCRMPSSSSSSPLQQEPFKYKPNPPASAPPQPKPAGTVQKQLTPTQVRPLMMPWPEALDTAYGLGNEDVIQFSLNSTKSPTRPARDSNHAAHSPAARQASPGLSSEIPGPGGSRSLLPASKWRRSKSVSDDTRQSESISGLGSVGLCDDNLGDLPVILGNLVYDTGPDQPVLLQPTTES